MSSHRTTFLFPPAGRNQYYVPGIHIGFFVLLYLCFGEAPNQRRISELEHKLERLEHDQAYAKSMEPQ